MPTCMHEVQGPIDAAAGVSVYDAKFVRSLALEDGDIGTHALTMYR